MISVQWAHEDQQPASAYQAIARYGIATPLTFHCHCSFGAARTPLGWRQEQKLLTVGWEENRSKRKGQRQIVGILRVYKEAGSITLQYHVLYKTAVSPKHLGNSGHREGQIGVAGREAFGEAWVFEVRNQDGQEWQRSQWDGCNILNMPRDKAVWKRNLRAGTAFTVFTLEWIGEKRAGFTLLWTK